MTDHTVDFFVELERDVWEALVNGDGEADRRLLSDDFVGVYPHGIEGRGAHAAHLASGPIVARYTMGDTRIRVLAADTVLLTYRADYQPIVDGVVGDEATMFVSSIWCRRETMWRNVFSQDTPAA